MEIETIHLENWMCRICLERGTYNIFEDRLVLDPKHAAALNPESSIVQGHQEPSSFESSGGASNNSTIKDSVVTIVDALNYFCEFKISYTEIANEPTMICENCREELLQCIKFRKKVNDAENLLRKEYDCDETSIEGKSDLTLRLSDIDPFLMDVPDAETPSSDDAISAEEQVSIAESSKQPKVHLAKPRFRLTNQVNNILRHVTTSSRAVYDSKPFKDKRRDSNDDLADLGTPKKIFRRYSTDDVLEKTLVVPSFIFSRELDGSEERNVMHVAQTTVPESYEFSTADFVEQQPDTEGGGTYYCQHCPKAFSSPTHLLGHTKSTHLCQYCLQQFPDMVSRNKHLKEAHKTFQCSLCSFRTQYGTNLRTHLRKTHAIALPAHVTIVQTTPE
ncbi:uncharacterized protein LOC129745530 [Uranotaenia lowii]|uniref:uncharacterized protein LOC129745530 n=1 Tax=Uranotaenia lowii TaxID=190385 RepID=UPI0024796B57|nr:uncharacterized protein LOC129745530 [Uranotaenia lowii]